ncbi:putative F0F1-ATPase subunit (Ca2+/Mg2+ transporter) [Natranaerovirga pectinivora]|uniref:Putative F0F1-ATPase subunit (Ca2+/Mg2+ transporter) n=1 Tax=Natranaerovirga pectinivora TaxID=682400 RepID=A0A4R3MIE5_9FIRM|nr:AtpZ/AtpI family protein [Natranaerovirga pectinivora]TCT13093.1 putative F0F1-ATPase subunit (Ca2+/Mg2+ transporter) [Natranaerovirga pectinivora]
MKIDPHVLKHLVLLNQIALTIIIPIIFCIFIGKWLDDKLGTNGVITFVFIILGLLAAIRNFFVITTRFLEEQKGSKK